MTLHCGTQAPLPSLRDRVAGEAIRQGRGSEADSYGVRFHEHCLLKVAFCLRNGKVEGGLQPESYSIPSPSSNPTKRELFLPCEGFHLDLCIELLHEDR